MNFRHLCGLPSLLRSQRVAPRLSITRHKWERSVVSNFFHCFHGLLVLLVVSLRKKRTTMKTLFRGCVLSNPPTDKNTACSRREGTKWAQVCVSDGERENKANTGSHLHSLTHPHTHPHACTYTESFVIRAFLGRLLEGLIERERERERERETETETETEGERERKRERKRLRRTTRYTTTRGIIPL